MTWFANDGSLHLRPNPDVEQSENGPLFTGTHICLLYQNKQLNVEHINRFLTYCDKIYRSDKTSAKKKERWWTTSISTNPRFSHDNYTGIICALKCIERWLNINYKKEHEHKVFYKETRYFLDEIPIFHKHPRDFIYYNYLRWPYLMLPFVWLVSLAMILTCYQTFKVRNGNKIIKTDGKILAFIRMIATPMPITWFICDWIVREKKHTTDSIVFKWHSWWFVFHEYYKEPSHPVVKLVTFFDQNRDH